MSLDQVSPLTILMCAATLVLGFYTRPVAGKDRTYRLVAQLVFYGLIPGVWFTPIGWVFLQFLSSVAPSGMPRAGLTEDHTRLVTLSWAVALLFQALCGIWIVIRSRAERRAERTA